MTPEERQMLAGLFDRVNAAGAQPRDAQAEALINDAVKSAPFAPYVLAQTVLVQQHALEAAAQPSQDSRRPPRRRRRIRAAASSAISAGRSSAPGRRRRRRSPAIRRKRSPARATRPRRPPGYAPQRPARGAARRSSRRRPIRRRAAIRLRRRAAASCRTPLRPRPGSLAASCSATCSAACSAAMAGGGLFGGGNAGFLGGGQGGGNETVNIFEDGADRGAQQFDPSMPDDAGLHRQFARSTILRAAAPTTPADVRVTGAASSAGGRPSGSRTRTASRRLQAGDC